MKKLIRPREKFTPKSPIIETVAWKNYHQNEEYQVILWPSKKTYPYSRDIKWDAKRLTKCKHGDWVLKLYSTCNKYHKNAK